jgi:integrase
MRFLNPREVQRLALAIDPQYRALVLVGCYGGLRIGELAGLRRSRVELTKGTVEIVEIADETGGHLTYGTTEDPCQSSLMFLSHSRSSLSLGGTYMKSLIPMRSHSRHHRVEACVSTRGGDASGGQQWTRRGLRRFVLTTCVTQR